METTRHPRVLSQNSSKTDLQNRQHLPLFLDKISQFLKGQLYTIFPCFPSKFLFKRESIKFLKSPNFQKRTAFPPVFSQNSSKKTDCIFPSMLPCFNSKYSSKTRIFKNGQHFPLFVVKIPQKKTPKQNGTSSKTTFNTDSLFPGTSDFF